MLRGCKSRQQRSPVAVVVIPSNGEGDRSVGSLEVKALGGRAYRSDPYRRASNLTGRSKCVNQKAPKDGPRVKRIAGGSGVPSCSELGEGHVDIDVLDQTMIELPGVREDGMLGRNGQRRWQRAALEECSEQSPEPPAGRLGAPAQRRHCV